MGKEDNVTHVMDWIYPYESALTSQFWSAMLSRTRSVLVSVMGSGMVSVMVTLVMGVNYGMGYYLYSEICSVHNF